MEGGTCWEMERKGWIGPKPAVHARLMLPLAPKSAAAILQAQQAALDRRLAQVEHTRRKAHLVVERARAVSSKLYSPPAVLPLPDQRWLRAKWRQCQRLVCIVARSRRHYRDVLGRVCRVKSARLLQRMFRTSWRRPSVPLMDFFALFPGNGDFADVRQYCVDPRVLESAKQMTNNDVAKAKMLVAVDGVLSVGQREVDICRFAANKLLCLCREQFTSQQRTSKFRTALDAFVCLFTAIQQQDKMVVCNQLFAAMVDVRVEFELGREYGNEYHQQFARLQHRLKQLLVGDGERYQYYLARCACEVKRRIQGRNVLRELVMDPGFQLPSSSVADQGGDGVGGVGELAPDQARQVVNELKRRINDLTPSRLDLHQELDEFVDVELISQQAKHNVGGVEWQRAVAFLVERVNLLQSPERSPIPPIATTLTEALNLLLGKVAEIERDVANLHLGVLGQYLQANAEAMERYVPRRRDANVSTADLAQWVVVGGGKCDELDRFEAQQVARLHSMAASLLSQAQNQIVLKQVVVLFAPELVSRVEQEQAGVDAAATLREWWPQGPVNPAAQDMLAQLLSSPTSSLRRILQRRLQALLLLPT
ncbi:hypothetical protein BASA81_008259, partial [Batrachochytrium salamandrivorans]